MTDLATALATQPLTPFEGKDVIRSTVEIPNAAGGLREPMKFEPVELHHGDEGYIVLRYVVDKVRHDPIKDTNALSRAHVLKAVDAAFISEEAVKAHLDQQAARIKLHKERLEGVDRLVGHDGDDTSVNPGALPPAVEDAGSVDTFAEDDEADVLDRQHKAGAHADGLRPGCAECEAEAEAVAVEQEGVTSISKARGKKRDAQPAE